MADVWCRSLRRHVGGDPQLHHRVDRRLLRHGPDLCPAAPAQTHHQPRHRHRGTGQRSVRFLRRVSRHYLVQWRHRLHRCHGGTPSLFVVEHSLNQGFLFVSSFVQITKHVISLVNVGPNI